MMSQFGKCNVCASPCSSCVRTGPELLPTGSTSNCMDHVESSSSITMVQAVNEDLKQDAVNSAKTIKLEECAASKFICCLNHEEDRTIEQSNVELHCQDSVFEGCDGESALLLDVKVCDICGDAGREEFLAICNKCNDGAEHIYCMRARLDKVPDSNWMCEECMLIEDKDKMSRNKFEKFDACQTYKSSNQSYQGDEISKDSDVKVLRRVVTKELGTDKSREDKVSSLSIAERASGNVTSASVTKGGTKSGQSLISRESQAPQAQGFTVKPRDQLSMPNELSSRSRSIQKNASLPTMLGRDLAKSRPLVMPTGSLTKSKSFNDSDKRPKVLRLDEIPQNQFSNETRNKKKGSTGRTMGKSLSFSNASSGHSNAFGTKNKRIPPKFSDDGDFKRSRFVKEHSSVEMTFNSEFKKPQVGQQKDGPCVSGPSHDKRFASHGEIMLQDVYGPRTRDPKAVQSSRDSATASEAKLCLPVANVVPDLLAPTRSGDSQEIKSKGEIKSRISLKSGTPLNCSDAIEENIPTTQKTSYNETEKGLQTSHFRLNTDNISKGSGTEYHNRNGRPDYASLSHPGDSPSVSVPHIAVVKDAIESSQMDISLPFCEQLDPNRPLAFPLCDYLWKGEFEIQSTGILSRVSYRIQAHLSSRASSRIPEVVNKFSDKILLEEVARLNAWPMQFLEFSPQDDSIGLYFFAEDIRSYGNYKSLLHGMVDYDLALRGNLDGIELLIFASHLLPESSKYWNSSLFLWGVFKQKMVNGS